VHVRPVCRGPPAVRHVWAPSSPSIANSEGGSGQNAVVLLDRPIDLWDASVLEREPRGNEKREYEICDQFTSRG
jgi:hypothetical protein